ncbi:MAG: T9SS type A sorting domain-containing protein [Flavobacteriales bacterium]|nr:T9SS type A sorting domain-containing protein [Flavobacteriales bacterium]
MRIILILVFYLTAGIVFSQPIVKWQKTIGGDLLDELRDIEQTSDGGFILGGYSETGISGDKTDTSRGSRDFWPIKLNSVGVIEWQRTIGGNSYDHLNSIEQTDDGGYILCGYSGSDSTGEKNENSQGGIDFWVIKLDALGQIQWQNTIGGSSADEIHEIRQTEDGGYVAVGDSYSGISGDKTENSVGDYDYWVVKLNSAGVITWQNCFGGIDEDIPYCIEQTSDGGYIVGGWSRSDSTGDKTEWSRGDKDYWVVKLDSIGIIQWDKTIGAFSRDEAYDIHQTSDGGYIVGGRSYTDSTGDQTEMGDGSVDFWVVKLSSTGELVWQNAIGGAGSDWLYAIHPTSDAGFVLGGYSNSGISRDKTEVSRGGSDYWVVKIDSLGVVQWDKTVGGAGNDVLRSIWQTTDGGFILGGFSDSDISGDKTENSKGDIDYWVVKLSPDPMGTAYEDVLIGNQMRVYPNPFSNRTVIEIDRQNHTSELILQVYNVAGMLMKTYQLSLGQTSQIIQASNYSPGIFFVTLTDDSVVCASVKFVILGN